MRFLRACLILTLACILTGHSPDQPAYARKKPKKGTVTQIPAEANFEEGLRREKNDDWEGAVDSFKQATYFARNNYYPQAYYHLGLCHMILREDGRAIEAFKKHITQQVGGSPEGWLNLGKLYLRNNRLDEARRAANKALGQYKYKDRGAAYNLYGMIFERQQNYGAAEMQYLLALGEAPWTYTEAWMNMADVMLRQGEFSNAAKQFKTMIDNGKYLKGLDYPRIHKGLAACLAAKGNHQGAIDNLRMAAEANPDDAESHLYLAKIFDQEKHVSSAINEYRRYLRLVPEGANTKLVKDRLAQLEGMARPVEARPTRAKPTPYMRKYQQRKVQEEQQAQEDLSGGFEEESGF